MTECPQAEACPACASTTGVQPTTGTSPRVQAWRCMQCDTSWAITTVRPQQPAYFEQLYAAVEQLGRLRWTLRQVIALGRPGARVDRRGAADATARAGGIVWCPVNCWYRRSIGDRDTHFGQLRDGRVHAVCGARFQPIIALPGLPSDGGQVCITCYRGTLLHR